MDWPERARLVGAILLAALLAALAATGGRASTHARTDARPLATNPFVAKSAPHRIRALRSLAPVVRNETDANAADAKVEHGRPPWTWAPTGTARPQTTAVQSSATTASGLTIATFPGIGLTNQYTPPDPNGAVGGNQYVELVNSKIEVFDKTTGAALYGPSDISVLWSGMGGLCQNWGEGDPVVVYDQVAQRWLISQFAFAVDSNNNIVNPFDECIAVSTSSDATGGWNTYSFMTSTHLLNDYPKIGVWPDPTNNMYVMTYNAYDNNNALNYAGAGVEVFNRAQMIAGQVATSLIFDPDSSPDLMDNEWSLLPSDFDGSTLPPSGSPAVLMTMDGLPWTSAASQLEAFDLSANWTGDTATISAMPGAPLAVASFDTNLCDYNWNCVPEKGIASFDWLDPLSDRPMFRLEYRNIGGYEYLTFVHTVNAGTSASQRAGIRWYELRKTASPTSAFSVYQQSTFAPADSVWRWVPSMSADAIGDLAVGYSVSNGSMVPGIRVTSRMWNDPLSTLRAESTMWNGTSSSDATYNRWGDYTDMTVDPADGCTFYYVNEYYTTTNEFNWSTRIGHFQLPGCAIGAGTFSPTSGNDGTVVTLNGSGFAPGATTVSFNGVASPTVNVLSPTQLTAVAPDGVTAGPISVTSPTGTATTPASFGIAVIPTSFAPDPVQVGDTVTITGSGFRRGGATPTVTVGSTAATVTSSTDTSIQFTVPDGALTAPITITGASGSVATASPLHVRPTVVLPASHGFARGVLTLTGAAFTGTTAVTSAGTPVPFTVLDYHHLRLVLPLNAATGTIAVTNAGGETDATYTIDPLISSFLPAHGPAGTSVRVTGSGFGLAGDTRVLQLNGTTVAATWLSPNSLRFTVPVGATSGPLSISVNGGTATVSARSFTVG